MATIAVFVSLGGTSYAALTITGRNVKDDSLSSRDIKDRSLLSRDIRDNTIQGRDLQVGAVNSDDIQDGSILLADFAPLERLRLRGDPGDVGQRGANGAAGPVGPIGATGPTGPPGPQGLRGTDGAPGPAGAEGPQGEPGVKGDSGDTGATGLQGPKGDTGDRGATGLQGVRGDDGDTGPQGPAGAGGTLLEDGNGATLGRVVSVDRTSAMVVTSTGHLVDIPFTGDFRPAQIYYTAADCGGTAYLNDGGIGVGPNAEDEFIYGKLVVFSGSQNTLMTPATVFSGYADNEEFTASTIDNPDCGPSAGQRSGWRLTPITRAAAGLPNTIATPLTFQ